MNNAEKFKQIFGLYATELWSMPESDFLEWLNRDVKTTQIDHTADIGKKISISCSQENDWISRREALNAITDELMPSTPLSAVIRAKNRLKELPSVQPDHNADSDKKVEQTGETAQNVQNEDLISRKWLVECIEEGWVKFDTAKDCNRMMHLVRDIAPSVQPEQNAQDEDLISREAAIEALARMMPRSYTPDGSHPADEEIYKAQEIYADCIESIEILPAIQPEIIRCKDCKYWRDDHTCHEHSLVSPMCANEYCSRGERRTDE